MDPKFIASETFEIIAIIAITAVGLITFVILRWHRIQKKKELLASFRASAIKNLDEARAPGLTTEIIFEKLHYTAICLISLNNLGDKNWQLKNIGTNENEIFSLLGLSFENIKSLADQGVRSADDIACIIERCREISVH